MDFIEANGNDEIIKYVEDALALRHSYTRELLKHLEDAIDDQRARTESIVRSLNGKLSSEGQKKSWCEVQLLIHYSSYLFLMIGLVIFFW